jgi:hypothetical protein
MHIARRFLRAFLPLQPGDLAAAGRPQFRWFASRHHD